MATLALFSCQDDKTVQNLNEKQGVSSNGGSKSDGNELKPGIVYKFYTISNNPDLTYETSIKLLEDETLLIAETKIKTTDVPDGESIKPYLTFMGIPVEDIYYNGQWVEYKYTENTICEIPIGFSDYKSGKENQPCENGVPRQLGNNGKTIYSCGCKLISNTNIAGTGSCKVERRLSDKTKYDCNTCDCKVDYKCYLESNDYIMPTSGKGGKTENTKNIFVHGLITVKAKNFKMVDKI